MPKDKVASKAARTMNTARYGSEAEKALALKQATEAARALGLRRANKKGGRKSLQEAGRKGAAAYWGQLTAEERRIEVRRRAMVRKRNKRERLAKKLEQQ